MQGFVCCVVLVHTPESSDMRQSVLSSGAAELGNPSDHYVKRVWRRISPMQYVCIDKLWSVHLLPMYTRKLIYLAI